MVPTEPKADCPSSDSALAAVASGDGHGNGQLQELAVATESQGVSPQEATRRELPLTIIQPRPAWQLIDFQEAWQYRELLYFLTWRDIKVRYAQTFLGAAWAVLQPFAQMVIFSIFFGRVAQMPTGGIAYPLFAFAGLLPWTFFQNVVTSSSGSVVGNQNLITKVYFPRLFIPATSVGVGIVDFVIAFGMMLVLMVYYRAPFSLALFLTVPLVLLLALAAFGVGTLLAALTVAYRDFRYVVPFMVQLWMFATPTIYMDATAVGPRWQIVLPLNPVYGLIYNFRAAALGLPLDMYALGVSTAVSFLILVIGCMYFRRVERYFADII
jgi:lipopolysaccharide transport system permease protein